MATTKIEILTQADKIVSAQIAQRRVPAYETLKGAWDKLGGLAAVSKGLRSEGDALPSEFAGGISDVIRSLQSFRSGYASNDPAQAVGAVSKRVNVPEFVKWTKGEIEKAATEDAPEALARLRVVSSVIKNAIAEVETASAALADKQAKQGVTKGDAAVSKADVEKAAADLAQASTSGVLIPASTDPMQQKPTATDDSAAKNPTGTGSPSTAESNFAANPGDVSTAAPSTAPNPSTLAAASLPGQGTGGAGSVVASGEPSFPAGATPNAVVPTTATTTATGGATNSGEDPNNFTTEDVAKSVSELQKAAEGGASRKRDGWSMDLNSAEFLHGQRKVDFGSDRSLPTK